MDRTRRVSLLGAPLELLGRYATHLERVETRARTADADAGRRLLQATAVIQERFGRFREQNRALVEEARAEGRESVDFHYDLPSAFAGDVAALLDALEEVEALALEPADPDVVAFWRWMLGDAYGQLLGHDPTPWSPARHEAVVRRRVRRTPPAV